MDRISALMDGELDEVQARRELARLRQDGKLRDGWDRFHVIGDMLRGEHPLSAQFNQRLSRRLAQEPTVLAPQRSIARKITTYALSAAASLAAVALVAWVAVSVSTVTAPPEIASVPAPAMVAATTVPAAPQLANVPDEGRKSEYLLAHQGFSPSTAIQGVAPYIRSVSVSQPADR